MAIHKTILIFVFIYRHYLIWFVMCFQYYNQKLKPEINIKRKGHKIFFLSIVTVKINTTQIGRDKLSHKP